MMGSASGLFVVGLCADGGAPQLVAENKIGQSSYQGH